VFLRHRVFAELPTPADFPLGGGHHVGEHRNRVNALAKHPTDERLDRLGVAARQSRVVRLQRVSTLV
jgi:hypothetical protein